MGTTTLPLQRLLRWRRTRLIEPTDRVAVLTHVADAGAFGPRFAFMMLMSVGIAMLGLLQNSAAVVIGAMLVAPLMGPIIELGMGLATFDLRTLRSALWTIAGGIALGLAMAMLIVWASPLKQPTAEILARTQPTFFDLLVAVFSGLAGAYATISRKGEAIVGVAIATALVPPLSVVGYGLMLRNWDIAGGASLLLLTNLLAIALSATIVARWYGFGGSDSPKQTALQAALIIGTLALLSVPLVVALKRITAQTQAELAVRSALDTRARELKGRISALRVEDNDGTLLVDAVLMTPALVEGVDAQLSRQLGDTLGRKVDVQLREVVTADEGAIAQQQSTLSELARSVRGLQAAQDERLAQRNAQRDAAARIDALLARRIGTQHMRADGGIDLRLQPQAGLNLAAARDLERALAQGADEAVPAVHVIPPLQALPPIAADADAVLSDAAREALQTQLWALQRWHVPGVIAVVRAGDAARGRGRLDAVRDALAAAGIAVVDARDATAADRRAAEIPNEGIWLRLPQPE